MTDLPAPDDVFLFADATEGLEVHFRPGLPVHALLLLDTLGVTIIEDENAPAKCPCGCASATIRGPQR